MPCPYQQGWKECQEKRKLYRKLLEQIIHLAKMLITSLKEDDKKTEGKKYFGPKALIFCISFYGFIYTLSAISAMFYNK